MINQWNYQIWKQKHLMYWYTVAAVNSLWVSSEQQMWLWQKKKNWRREKPRYSHIWLITWDLKAIKTVISVKLLTLNHISPQRCFQMMCKVKSNINKKCLKSSTVVLIIFLHKLFRSVYFLFILWQSCNVLFALAVIFFTFNTW